MRASVFKEYGRYLSLRVNTEGGTSTWVGTWSLKPEMPLFSSVLLNLWILSVLVTRGILLKFNVTVLNCVQDEGIRCQLPPVVCKLFQSTCIKLGSANKGKTVPLKIYHICISYLICGLHICWSCLQDFVSLLFPPPFCVFWYWFP